MLITNIKSLCLLKRKKKRRQPPKKPTLYAPRSKKSHTRAIRIAQKIGEDQEKMQATKMTTSIQQPKKSKTETHHTKKTATDYSICLDYFFLVFSLFRVHDERIQDLRSKEGRSRCHHHHAHPHKHTKAHEKKKRQPFCIFFFLRGKAP